MDKISLIRELRYIEELLISLTQDYTTVKQKDINYTIVHALYVILTEIIKNK